MATDELEKICVPPTLPIKAALQVLEDGHRRIVLVVDHEYRLLGVVADSDIRRAILKGLSFEKPIKEIMVKKPIVASDDMDDHAIISMIKVNQCYEIPIVDSINRIVGLRTLDTFIGQKQEAEAVIMAGGMGTRLRPLTKDIPKPLVQLDGKPILFILLDQLILSGFRKITLALNYKAALIRRSIEQMPKYIDRVNFIEEKERLGTAGALSLLPGLPERPFFVMNCDLLTKVDFRAMLAYHEKEENSLTMAVRIQKFQLPFGVVKMNAASVDAVEEKPIQSYFANAGIYILNPKILEYIPKNEFYDMPDLVNSVIHNKHAVGSFPIHEYWLDIGQPRELRQAQKDINLLWA